MVVVPDQIVDNNAKGIQLVPFDMQYYEVRTVDGDGDCGYHAFLASMRTLYPDVDVPRNPKALRKVLVDSIKHERKLPRMMQMRSDVKRETLGRIQSGLDDPGTGWMENDEMEMLANLYGVCIAVWSVAFELWVFVYPSDMRIDGDGLEGCVRVIYLYNSRGEGNGKLDPSKDNIDYSIASGFHYDYLIPIKAVDQGKSESSATSAAASASASASTTERDDTPDDVRPDQKVIDDVKKMSVVKRFAFFKDYIKKFEESQSYAQKKQIIETALEMKPVLKAHRVSEHPEYHVNGTPNNITTPGNTFFFTKKQKFLQKFMSINTDNRAVLLFHDVGVGKTCTSILIAENFVHMFDRQVLIFLPSSLEQNYRKELFDESKLNFDMRTYEACSGSKYLDNIPSWHTLSRKEIRRKVNKMINQEYGFFGYLKIVNLVKKYKKKAKNLFKEDHDARELYVFNHVREKFSNRVIIIDEIHNIRLSNDASMKAFPKVLKMILWCSENVRLVLLSATPMFDHPEELSWIMQFAYLADKSHKTFNTDIAFTEEGVLTDASASRIKYFAKNYVSYMSGFDPNTFGLKYFVTSKTAYDEPKRDLLTKEPIDGSMNSDLYRFYSTHMRGHQLKAYRKVTASSFVDDTEDSDEVVGHDVHNAIQISNIAYPTEEGESNMAAARGERGFRRNFKISKDKRAMHVSYIDESQQFLHPTQLSKYASKLSEIVAHIRSCKGLVLVYSRYIYAGLVPLALALEHVGFSKYGGANILRGENVKRERAEGKSSYIIITADDKFSPNNTQEIAAFNRPDNSAGAVIKVALINDVAAEGVSFKNVREIHMLEPWYNMHKIDQIIGRGVRYKSHTDLEHSQRNVGVYLYVNRDKRTDVESIDHRRYRIALGKQGKIDQIERVLKQNAVDCILNDRKFVSDARLIRDSKGDRRTLNVVSDNVSCEYKLKDQPDPIDMNPRMLIFEVVDMAKYLRHLIETHGMHHFAKEDLKRHGVGDNELLDSTIRYMLHTKMPVVLNKTKGFLIKSVDRFVFQPFKVADCKIGIYDRTLKADELAKVVRKFAIVHRDEAAANSDVRAEQGAQKDTSSSPKTRAAEFNQKYDAMRAPIIKMMQQVIRTGDVDDSVVDAMVADRIEMSDVHMIPNISSSSLRASLEDAMVIGKDYYVDVYHDKVYYTDSNKKYKEAGFKRKNAVLTLAEKRLRDLREGGGEIYGFIEIDGEDLKSKIKHRNDPSRRSTGSACVSTSTFKTAILQSYIHTYEPSASLAVINGKKTDKKQLCMIYEYFLRANKAFARPLEYKLLDKN